MDEVFKTARHSFMAFLFISSIVITIRWLLSGSILIYHFEIFHGVCVCFFFTVRYESASFQMLMKIVLRLSSICTLLWLHFICHVNPVLTMMINNKNDFHFVRCYPCSMFHVHSFFTHIFPYNHINDQASKCNGNDIRFHLRSIVLLLVEKMENQTREYTWRTYMDGMFMCLSFMKDERVTRAKCILYRFFFSNGQTTLNFF